MLYTAPQACACAAPVHLSCLRKWYEARGDWVTLACMDCGKEFEGEAYKQHVSCMSEAQRYEGKLYQPKENKGEAKQQAWTDGVQQRLQSAPGMAA